MKCNIQYINNHPAIQPIIGAVACMEKLSGMPLIPSEPRSQREPTVVFMNHNAHCQHTVSWIGNTAGNEVGNNVRRRHQQHLVRWHTQNPWENPGNLVREAHTEPWGEPSRTW